MSFERTKTAITTGILFSTLVSSEVAGGGEGARVEKLYGQVVHTLGETAIAVCSTEMSSYDVFGISHTPLDSQEDLDYALATNTLTGEGSWASKNGAGTCSMPAEFASRPLERSGTVVIDMEDLFGPRAE